MKDAIDIRNEKEKIQKSIVKRSNVHYITREELKLKEQDEIDRQQIQEERGKADEILKRLEMEAQEDEAKKVAEIQEILRQQELDTHNRPETYGTTPMDGLTQERVEAILNDKEKKIQQIVLNGGMDSEN